jgi:hypothetical protein
MSLNRIVIGSTSLVILLGVTAVERWMHAVPRARSTPFAVDIVPPFPAAPADSAIAESADTLVENDPFRLANEPASIRFDPRTESGTSAATMFVAPPPLRPTLTLRAIVGGPPWQAIVDGIPGEPNGAVVGRGDVFGRIAVVAVKRDTVLLRGSDTTWILTFRRHP